jgi:fatty-acyl-CoA synthase
MMQSWPLTVDRILDHAATRHARREVVTRSLEGPIHRTTYAEIRARAKQVSNLLLGLGVRPGDRVATLALNTWRHMEVWYGIMGIGAVCHTLNPRLHPDQICWIINHAEDRVIFVDEPFEALLKSRIDAAPSVERVVVLNQEYEDLISGQGADCAWGGFDEETACGLCYTSGTTGDPKGVLYSHRSNFLHTLLCLQADVTGCGGADVILPVTPMFHANAWGVIFSAPAVGAKLVLPGVKLDGASVHELLETEGVTVSCAVPTVWTGLLQYLDETKARLTTLRKVLIGGSACPEAIIRGFHERYGVEVLHAWGMTETSPVATVGTLDAETARLPFTEQIPFRLKQGRPHVGSELKITDDEGRRLAEDGRTVGRLKIRGPMVAGGYFKGVGGHVLDEEGFFDTGDIAALDPDGVVQITDRAKDVIKSGGEWISSVEIENIAASHPKALIAAVIGVPHPKWDERPLLLVKLKPGEASTREEMLGHLQGKIAKWWIPDEVLFVDDIPLGATGKIDKKAIRAAYADYRLPGT